MRKEDCTLHFYINGVDFGEAVHNVPDDIYAMINFVGDNINCIKMKNCQSENITNLDKDICTHDDLEDNSRCKKTNGNLRRRATTTTTTTSSVLDNVVDETSTEVVENVLLDVTESLGSPMEPITVDNNALMELQSCEFEVDQNRFTKASNFTLPAAFLS